jgi:hypothetical protein
VDALEQHCFSHSGQVRFIQRLAFYGFTPWHAIRIGDEQVNPVG